MRPAPLLFVLDEPTASLDAPGGRYAELHGIQAAAYAP
jgi:ABC-type protease/lipase transport system fused ATPase/permease subunit